MKKAEIIQGKQDITIHIDPRYGAVVGSVLRGIVPYLAGPFITERYEEDHLLQSIINGINETLEELEKKSYDKLAMNDIAVVVLDSLAFFDPDRRYSKYIKRVRPRSDRPIKEKSGSRNGKKSEAGEREKTEKSEKTSAEKAETEK